ncbi:MAG: hypothetical protein PF440_00420 [Thiomicrorhabdus sp.]|nr:hypothetical protein [Thiomicrorhabdus sp.]
MKLLFLDIDGVLSDPEAVAPYNRLDANGELWCHFVKSRNSHINAPILDMNEMVDVNFMKKIENTLKFYSEDGVKL